MFFSYTLHLEKDIVASYLTTWPSLTVEMVTKYLDKSTATSKGHLNQQRQNLQSTTKMGKLQVAWGNT
eukprot:2137304-Ditylum_brightwellii.AAC.1